jgi:serine/threonine-protein kinase haspin
MRTHLFTGTRTMFPADWHNASSRSENNGHTWADFTPYSNVIWLRYLLSYLIKTCKKDLEGSFKAMMDFERETRELQSKLNVRTLKENGAFMKAQDVLEYVAQKGWVSEEQLVESGVDTTFMSDVSRVEEA